MSVTQQDQPAAAAKTRIVLQTSDVRVVEYVLQPRDRHPWHHHSEVADRFYCLEGQIEVETREPPRAERLHPGQTLTVEPAVVHRAGNAADGVSRYLLVQGIGRYDFVKAS
jgi:quercetin dioxygenase-like cupin family protein